MATFKVGQRARIIDGIWGYWIGREVEIIGPLGTYPLFPDEYAISRPEPWHAEDEGVKTFSAPARHLAPLTPPAADAWAADAVRKVTKPQHVEPEVAERLREFDRLIGN
jgi:hypothetical protein